MRNITRLLKATALVVGSYYAGNIAGGIMTMMWGWYFGGWASVAGICIAGVQGFMGVFIFEQLVEHFRHDIGFRFRVAAVMAWGLVGLELPVAVLHAWMFGVGIDDALSLAASIVASAPWCYWTTKNVLESRRATLAMAA
jgi:hypothetical protein